MSLEMPARLVRGDTRYIAFPGTQVFPPKMDITFKEALTGCVFAPLVSFSTHTFLQPTMMLGGETEAQTFLRPAQTITDISFSVGPQSYHSPTHPLIVQWDHDL